MSRPILCFRLLIVFKSFILFRPSLLGFRQYFYSSCFFSDFNFHVFARCALFFVLLVLRLRLAGVDPAESVCSHAPGAHGVMGRSRAVERTQQSHRRGQGMLPDRHKKRSPESLRLAGELPNQLAIFFSQCTPHFHLRRSTTETPGSPSPRPLVPPDETPPFKSVQFFAAVLSRGAFDLNCHSPTVSW